MTDKILAANIANQASFAKLTNLVMTVPVTRITAHKQKVPSGQRIAHRHHYFTTAFSSSTLQVNTEEGEA